MPNRTIQSVERRVHSQNGEDGIIEHLVGALIECNKTFYEIGCGTGERNNCTWLAQQGWVGVSVDRKHKRISQFLEMSKREALRVAVLAVTLTPSIAHRLVEIIDDPDVFSIDIDSIDWHIVRAMTLEGFRPKIAVCEYNATFMAQPVTVPWPMKGRTKETYFGASTQAWRNLWEPLGYRFVTVDSTGTNCFFIREDATDMTTIDMVDWLSWRDSEFQRARTQLNARRRWEQVRKRPLLYV